MWILYIAIPIILIVGLVIFLIIFLSKNVSPTSARWHSYTSDTKGDFGELRVESVLGETVEGEKYVINNYTIEKDGKSSQIDHIFINQFGVFVIETKNYSGDIYGNDQQLKWTQVLNYGRIKNQFYNPVKQNASHVYKIRAILPHYPIRSLVVFVQGNIQHINSATVVSLYQLRNAINTGTRVLNTQQMRNAYDMLLQHRSSITKEEHVNNIRKQQKDLQNNICPRCGGTLVLRSGQYGQFYGCSNYPKCKFKKKS